MSAVIIPIGNSDGATIVRANKSAKVSNIAPVNAEAGKICLLSGPKIKRNTCGTTNPTKPIIPQTATDAPIAKALITIILILVDAMFIPK